MVRAPKNPCTYILASRRNGTLYVGVTSDLVARIWQHKCDIVAGFTRKYRTHLLVWKANPHWRDLYGDLL